jgi:hypothetical protein
MGTYERHREAASAAPRSGDLVEKGPGGAVEERQAPLDVTERALEDPTLRVRELAGEALNRIVSPGPNQPMTLPSNSP